MIETSNLSKRFDSFLAVDAVTLQVRAGEVLALLGPNGAGKTTTVRMLTSVLTPSEGWARVAGYDVVQQSAQVRASVGVLTENHGLYNRMPAHEYLDFFGELYGLEATLRKQRTSELLEQFGIGEYKKRPLGEFSKGMRQKLALARALLHNPPVLLFDEPTSAMDPESARLVRDSIHDLRSADRTIVICTHNLAEAEELADQIAIIRQGRIIALGSPSELKAGLLGPPQYQLRLAKSLDGFQPTLPPGCRWLSGGEDWLRYEVDDPDSANPYIIQECFQHGIPVISMQEVTRSLEQVYLHAISSPDKNEEGQIGSTIA